MNHSRLSLHRTFPVWVAAFFAFGCSPKPAQTASTTADTTKAAPAVSPIFLAAAQAALPPAGFTAADLPDPNSAGAQLVAQYCQTCHSLPTPLMHSATDWPSVVRRMLLRMDRVAPDFKLQVPDAGQRIVLLDYMLANALKVSGATLPAGPGREAFARTCSRCHELPDPRQHSGSDWIVVVRRMNGHMEQMLGQTLPTDTRDQITNYLERIGGRK